MEKKKNTVIYYPLELGEPEVKKIFNLAVDGLLTDGSHHKQWYLEQIIEVLRIEKKDLRQWLREQDYDYDDGTAP